MEGICKARGLRFRVKVKPAAVALEPKQHPRKEIADALPPFSLHAEDKLWQSDNRIKIVMDNSAVVGVGSGKVKLEFQFTTPTFRKYLMYSSIFSLAEPLEGC